jgi:hypothetical protein
MISLDCPEPIIQLGSLVVAAIGLVYLVKYVRHTKEIAEQSVIQTEATFKPAVIAVHGDDTQASARLRNIGNGPALDVEWTITGADTAGKFACIEVGDESDPVPSSGLANLQSFAVQTGTNKVAIRCSYRSISGMQYSSESEYDFRRFRFSTTFAGGLQKR